MFMGSEEAEAVEPKMSLLSVSPKMKSASGTHTPPLQGCSAAVPFHWEEQPGKPRSPTTTTTTAHLELDLPPRLVAQQPSPTIKKRPKASSFRMPRARTRARDINSGYGSFSFSPDHSERAQGKLHVGPIVLSRRWLWQSKEKGSSNWFFRGWKKSSEMKGKVAADDKQDQEQEQEQEWTNTKNSSSALLSSSQTKSQFWATMYGGLKQVMPWKARPGN